MSSIEVIFCLFYASYIDFFCLYLHPYSVERKKMDKNVIKQIILWQQEFVGKVRLQNRSVSFDENANYV